eukprot:TRINITY_DN8170_c0_g1_i1.p1 TRINITY_DN8170_c0_g1~~TRINITY_DN8170_c0_g1_i1.p1  ORF type:complete len:472 (+),score=129.51 TRINITY_DN8170_c0_g1_i1:68-1483(+)
MTLNLELKENKEEFKSFIEKNENRIKLKSREIEMEIEEIESLKLEIKRRERDLKVRVMGLEEEMKEMERESCEKLKYEESEFEVVSLIGERKEETRGGYKDGSLKEAKFRQPTSLSLTKNGESMYVCDCKNDCIRKIDLKGEQVTTIVGLNGSGYKDGFGNEAKLNQPHALCLNGNDSVLYVNDAGNFRIRKIELNNEMCCVSTIAGCDEQQGSNNSAANSAKFCALFGITIDHEDNYLYIADLNCLKRISLKNDNQMFIISGTKNSPLEFEIESFFNLVMHPKENSLLIIDNNYRILKIDLNDNSNFRIQTIFSNRQLYSMGQLYVPILIINSFQTIFFTDWNQKLLFAIQYDFKTNKYQNQPTIIANLNLIPQFKSKNLQNNLSAIFIDQHGSIYLSNSKLNQIFSIQFKHPIIQQIHFNYSSLSNQFIQYQLELQHIPFKLNQLQLQLQLCECYLKTNQILLNSFEDN